MVMAFECVDQTCPLTNAAERDKRSSPGILGTVQELNVLGTEAVGSTLCDRPWKAVWAELTCSVYVSEALCRLCHLGRSSGS